MYKTLFAPLLILVGSINTVQATEKVENALLKCSKIESHIERLECFDLLVKKLNHQPKSELVVETKKPIIKEVKKSITKNKEVPAKGNKEDLFGKTEAQISTIDTLKSNIVGEFRGWKKGAVITLANGQKWKVTSQNAGYVKLMDPKVEISRAMLGSFKMKVEGLNASAKVKRIK